MAVLELEPDAEPPVRPASGSCAPPVQSTVELEDVLLVSTTPLPFEADHWPIRAVDAPNLEATCKGTHHLVLCGAAADVTSLLSSGRLDRTPLYVITDSAEAHVGSTENMNVAAPAMFGWADVSPNCNVRAVDDDWPWEATIATICSRHISTIPCMILRQASLQPSDRPAVIDDAGCELSYQALCSRAWQLGASLVGGGCEAGDAVGVMLSPSALTVVCLLGLGFRRLVPTTLSALEALRAKQLARVRCRAILAQDDTLHALTPDGAAAALLPGLPRVIRVDLLRLDDATPLCEVQRGVGKSGCSLDDVAFIDWTSGSTGAPKGMATTQFKMAHWIRWRAYHWPLQVYGARVAMGLFFAWYWHIPLAQGGTLVVIPSQHQLDVRALVSYMAAHRVDWIDCFTPGQLGLATELCDSLASLSHVMCSGEAVRPKHGLPRLPPPP